MSRDYSAPYNPGGEQEPLRQQTQHTNVRCMTVVQQRELMRLWNLYEIAVRVKHMPGNRTAAQIEADGQPFPHADLATSVGGYSSSNMMTGNMLVGDLAFKANAPPSASANIVSDGLLVFSDFGGVSRYTAHGIRFMGYVIAAPGYGSTDNAATIATKGTVGYRNRTQASIPGGSHLYWRFPPRLAGRDNAVYSPDEYDPRVLPILVVGPPPGVVDQSVYSDFDDATFTRDDPLAPSHVRAVTDAVHAMIDTTQQFTSASDQQRTANTSAIATEIEVAWNARIVASVGAAQLAPGASIHGMFDLRKFATSVEISFARDMPASPQAIKRRWVQLALLAINEAYGMHLAGRYVGRCQSECGPNEIMQLELK